MYWDNSLSGTEARSIHLIPEELGQASWVSLNTAQQAVVTRASRPPWSSSYTEHIQFSCFEPMSQPSKSHSLVAKYNFNSQTHFCLPISTGMCFSDFRSFLPFSFSTCFTTSPNILSSFTTVFTFCIYTLGQGLPQQLPLFDSQSQAVLTGSFGCTWPDTLTSVENLEGNILIPTTVFVFFSVLPSNSPIPNGYPTIQLNSDTTYLEIVSDSQVKDSVPHGCPHPSLWYKLLPVLWP